MSNGIIYKAMTMTLLIMDLLTLGLDPYLLVTTLLEFFNLDLTLEAISATMVAKPIRLRKKVVETYSAEQNDSAHILAEQLIAAGVVPLTAAEFWKQRSEVDTGQVTNNPNLLAARILARGGPYSAHDLNVVLAQQGYNLTQIELVKLLDVDYTTYQLTAMGVKSSNFLSLYPQKVPVGNGRWGIYMYVNNITGVVYVGSSTVLHERLRHYWKKWAADKKLRPILADIKKYGLENFTLHVYELPVKFYDKRLMLGLEQYYLFSMYPGNNSIMVAGGSPGGEHLRRYNSWILSEPVYMYESSTLLYVFNSISGQFDSVHTVTGINHNSVAFSIRDGSLVYGKLTFAMGLLNMEDVPLFESKESLQNYLATLRTDYETDRVARFAAFARQDSSTPAVKITRVYDGFVWKCDHIWGARQLYKTLAGKTMTTDTVNKRIKSGVALNGFVFALWTANDKESPNS